MLSYKLKHNSAVHTDLRDGVETVYAVIEGYYLLKSAAQLTVKAVTGTLFKSFDDIAIAPQNLYGKSANEIETALGEGWTKGTYGSSGKGWKFTNGDKSVFYNPSSSAHGGSEYWGFSSGKHGKNKVVGPDYKSTKSDKAKIITN